ncbi:MAG TPA: histidine kinase dimerization/phospho-acceptor domain-containing protein [Xanthobacteraceae bacterium]|jgi:PAS domain S-box-containing protein|nr:histidine kinase dimerization/phospho-acceptor domain-containing protein [Xanthobacteraceae bacterium]
MTNKDPYLALLLDRRLAVHATSPVPVWLWTPNATHILWANAGAAAMIGPLPPADLPHRRFSMTHPMAAQIAQLAGSLPHSGAPRLERLRGIGPGVGRTLVCACSRLQLTADTSAILVVAGDTAKPLLPLAERAKRMIASMQEPIALFTSEGTLLHATENASKLLGVAQTLAAIGAERIAVGARSLGRANGESAIGPMSMERWGADSSTVLMAVIAAPDVAAIPAASNIPAALTTSINQITPAEKTQEESSLEVTIRGAPDVTPSEPIAPALEQTLSAPVKNSVDDKSQSNKSERKHPLRFVWQMDTDGRFTCSNEFAAAVGSPAAALIGKSWSEIAGTLGIDPEGRIADAVKSRDTWSGIVLTWPIDGSDERLRVEFSGLPVFDHSRGFSGYRGFGVCRDVVHHAAASDVTATEKSAEVPSAAASPSDPPKTETEVSADAEESRPLLTVVPAAKNVVPFRGTALAPDKRPILTSVERSAFHEIAKALGARLEDETLAATQAPAAEELRSSSQNTESAEAKPSHAEIGEDAELQSPDKKDASLIPPSSAAEIEESSHDKRAVQSVLHIESIVAKEAVSALRRAEAEARELRAILDTATDGVVVLERSGKILTLNRSAEALFGYESHDLAGYAFGDLFAPESQRAAIDYLESLASNGVASLLNDGREVIGRVRQGGLIPLFMTMGRIADGGEKFCAVFRDITQWKRAEEELVNAKRQAERASSAKSDFLAKISHEIRTPLNAIIGFSEVMMEERFGPIGNERYREYLKDIHASGGHLVSLINDLLDLSKIEAGKLDLTFSSVHLNELIQQCVALMQPQANRERIIIRTSLSPTLPPIVVDARSIRQIVLNLLSNSVKFTGAGGQVIVSTALTGHGDAVLRVRDTGVGMSEKEIETALEPFRQLATSSRWGSGGTGLGLPLTKALVEANRATFAIKSAVNAGTLVEITFPSTRVLAE